MNIENNRLKQPHQLPDVDPGRAGAEEFFRGWWAGIAVGGVTAAGLIVVLMEYIK